MYHVFYTPQFSHVEKSAPCKNIQCAFDRVKEEEANDSQNIFILNESGKFVHSNEEFENDAAFLIEE